VGQWEIWRAGGEGRVSAFCFDDRLLDSLEVDWCCFSTLSLCGPTGWEEIQAASPLAPSHTLTNWERMRGECVSGPVRHHPLWGEWDALCIQEGCTFYIHPSCKPLTLNVLNLLKSLNKALSCTFKVCQTFLVKYYCWISLHFNFLSLIKNCNLKSILSSILYGEWENLFLCWDNFIFKMSRT